MPYTSMQVGVLNGFDAGAAPAGIAMQSSGRRLVVARKEASSILHSAALELVRGEDCDIFSTIGMEVAGVSRR